MGKHNVTPSWPSRSRQKQLIGEPVDGDDTNTKGRPGEQYMIELSDEPWQFFEQAKARWHPTRLDILSGFIGTGASQALATLGVSARIIIGLPGKNPSLSQAQLDELGQLLRSHEVRSLPGLHAKMYVFDQDGVILGSANFTRSGFEKLDEIVVLTDDPSVVRTAKREFEKRWEKASKIHIEQIAVAKSGSGESTIFGALGSPTSSRPSGFSTVAGLKTVRLCAYWPKWLDELNHEETVNWSTSPRAKKGDLQLFAITKPDHNSNASGAQVGVDAIHSLWRVNSKVRHRPGNQWPIGATFQLVLRLENPVPKKRLIKSGILNGGRWPQTTNGKIYKDRQLCKLIEILKADNPTQAIQIDTVFRI